MQTLEKHRNLLFLAASVAVLAGCGSEEIASPGSGGNVTVNVTTPPPPPPPPPPASTLVTPAAGCPTIDDSAGLRDIGTITGATGTYRVCELPARLTRSSNLPRVPGLLYSIGGRVDVGDDCGPSGTPAGRACGVVLTIQPGVIIYGATGTSWLHVNRGNRINAVGTATQPIVFTSRDNVLGLTTDDSQGQWGGVVLSGRAPITDCRVPAAPPGTAECDRSVEGAVDLALYGGATPNDNSGTLRYVQIRYSGFVLSGNSELQALTTGGVGSGTSISFVHLHNSSDDGLEFFGGTHNATRFVITGADDDSVDVDMGYRGLIQHVIAVQKTSGAADSMIELDSANALEDQQPRTFLKLANFTFVHRNAAAGNQAAMLFRGGADAALVNGVMTTSTACLRLSGANMITANAGIGKVGAPTFRSVAMQCGATPFVGSSGLTAQQVADTFNVAGNNSTASFTASLTGGFVNGANETGRTATDPKTVDAGFETTAYIGAVSGASDTWYAGWTCNSATANFGTSSTACTTLPRITQ
jgi:hypothetical protein